VKIPIQSWLQRGQKLCSLLRQLRTKRPAPAVQQMSSLYLWTEADDRSEYWLLTPEALTRLDKWPDKEQSQGMVLSFSAHDLVNTLNKSTSLSKLKSEILREHGERVRVIQKKIGKQNYCFSTPTRRTDVVGMPVYSGMSLIVELLNLHQKSLSPGESQALITGFMLGKPDDHLLILMIAHPGHRFTHVQYIPRVTDVQGALLNYGRAAKVVGTDAQLNEEQVLLFDGQELYSVWPSSKPYPSEGDWLGVPFSKFQTGLSLSMAVLALGSLGGLFYFYMLTQAVQDQIKKAELIRQVAEEQIRKTALEKMRNLAQLSSVQLNQAVSRAQALYPGEGRVILDAGAQRTLISHVVAMRVMDVQQVMGPHLQGGTADSCGLESIQSTVSLNEIQVNHVCIQAKDDLIDLFFDGVAGER
jgi:hypothetical protein